MPSQPEERGQPTRIGLNQTHRSRTRPDQAFVARRELTPLIGINIDEQYSRLQPTHGSQNPLRQQK